MILHPAYIRTARTHHDSQGAVHVISIRGKEPSGTTRHSLHDGASIPDAAVNALQYVTVHHLRPIEQE